METRIFSLESRENNKITRIFQIIFGVICIVIAVFWLIFNFRSIKTDRTVWITIIFLFCFGAFLIYSGLGLASRFIGLGTGSIRLKNNFLFPAIDISIENIEKIEIFPLKVLIFRKASKKILIRFGVIYVDNVELIKDEIISFASANNILIELKNEEIL
jgi:RsiW-degrading membrane proteinase PrsW (M82 family)